MICRTFLFVLVAMLSVHGANAAPIDDTAPTGLTVAGVTAQVREVAEKAIIAGAMLIYRNRHTVAGASLGCTAGAMMGATSAVVAGAATGGRGTGGYAAGDRARVRARRCRGQCVGLSDGSRVRLIGRPNRQARTISPFDRQPLSASATKVSTTASGGTRSIGSSSGKASARIPVRTTPGSTMLARTRVFSISAA